MERVIISCLKKNFKKRKFRCESNKTIQASIHDLAKITIESVFSQIQLSIQIGNRRFRLKSRKLSY